MAHLAPTQKGWLSMIYARRKIEMIWAAACLSGALFDGALRLFS